MVRSEPLLTIALLVMSASCNRHPDDDRARTAAAQRENHSWPSVRCASNDSVR
jgi:hypothetical protein